jgi:hypothetical protein
MERRVSSGEQSARRRRGAPPSGFDPFTTRLDARHDADDTLAQLREEAEFEFWHRRTAIALEEERSALMRRRVKRAREEWRDGWLDAIRIVRSLALTALLIATFVLLLLNGVDDLGIAELIAKVR